MAQTTAVISFLQLVFDILLPHQTTKMFDINSKKTQKHKQIKSSRL